MKRLITILVLFTGFVAFTIGQTTTLPVAVIGDVYVSTSGALRSKGNVHVKMDSISKKKGVIDNYGKLKFDSGVFLYSNEEIDGLLRNNYEATVEADSVVVRKFFANVGDPENNQGYFYQFSLPFNVSLASKYYGASENVEKYGTDSKVFKSDGTEALLWDDYYVDYYSTYRRTFITRQPSNNWIVLDMDSSIYGNNIAYLEKGNAYRIFSVSSHYLDFVLKAGDSISNLFINNNQNQSKVKPLTYFKDTSNQFADNTPSEGWNIIGGLNTASFKLHKDHVTYGIESGVIYYTDPSEENGWKELYLGDTDSLRLSPYVAFFVQTAETANSFTFKNTGLRVGAADPVSFRAAEVATKDMLRLTIAKEGEPSISDKTYIELNADYKDGFQIGEDGLKMLDSGEGSNSSSKSPKIYSWFNKTFENTQTRASSTLSYQLVLNRLPSVGLEGIKLGVIVPEDGRYTFSLNAIQRLSVENAVLRDDSLKQYTDLLKGPYSCFLKKGEVIKDRFVLFVNTSALPIDEVVVDRPDIFAYTNNNVLVVKNIQKGDQVRILDLSGRTIVSEVASTNEFTAPLVQKGVYIVNIKGEKNAVLKVMNK
jgi:hypothetical protein